MAISFVQWEKYVQSFPDDRLGQEFQDPGSTVAGEEKPPQAVIIAEMGTRNAARKADKAMQASQGEPSGTIGEQTYDEFAGESRPAGGPGGGPPPGAMKASKEQGAMKASKGQPGGPPMGPGGPPPGGPPMGGPPMMAYGGSVPGYQYGGSVPGYQDGGDTEDPGWMRKLVGMATGADSWEDAAENPFRTAGQTALTGSMFIPGAGLVGAGVRGALGLAKGARAAKALRGLGGLVLRLEGRGGLRGKLGRALGAPSSAGNQLQREGRLLASTIDRGRRMSPGGRALVDTGAIGRKALLRGGGGLGVASLLALDPFDGPASPEETAPPPNTNLADSSAVRADRSKGFANGAYDWLDEESPTERNLRRLLDYRSEGIASGELTEDFQDESLREFIEDLNQRERSPGYVAPRQGYADLPEMASGGFAGMGYHEGGNIPIHEHGSGPGQHLAGPVSYRREDPRDYEGTWTDYLADLAPGEAAIEARKNERSEGFQDYKANFLENDLGYGDMMTEGEWLRANRGLGTMGAREMFGRIGNAIRNPNVKRIESEDEFNFLQGRPDDMTQVEAQRRFRERQGVAESVLGSSAAAESLGDPARSAIPVGPIDLEGMGSQSAPEPSLLESDPLSLDETIGLADERLYDATLAREEELRTQNPAERAQEEYWNTRLGREEGNRFNILAADVAETIANRGGPGDIARGLANAARNQVEQGRLITDLEGLPFAEDVRRSRESTYPDQLTVLGETANRLGSRGELEATLQQRMAEIEDTLSREGRLTLSDMTGIEEILRQAERYELMDQEEIDAWRTSYMQKFLDDGFPSSAR